MDKTVHERWCEEYRKKRYLEHATNQDLTQRPDDIAVNLLIFTAAGEAVVRTPLESNRYAPLLVHFMHELSLRAETRYTFPTSVVSKN